MLLKLATNLWWILKYRYFNLRCVHQDYHDYVNRNIYANFKIIIEQDKGLPALWVPASYFEKPLEHPLTL